MENLRKDEFYFKHRAPIAPLKIIAMDNCRPLVEAAEQYIIQLRKEYLAKYADLDPTVLTREYDRERYLAEVECPRFGSGEAKGNIKESVRGCDLFIVSDVTNNSMTFKINGRTHYMSPDDHYQDLKRIVAAAMSSAHRISVIMPFLYQSRQHKRVNRESLDCAIALQELSDMGVANIVTFDAHDPCVQNAIPLHDFDSYSPVFHFMRSIRDKFGLDFLDRSKLVIVSPDEGAMSRAVYLANNMGVEMGMFYKRRDYTRIENGVNPVVSQEYIGTDVEGKTVIIMDDIISTGVSILDTAREMHRRKAAHIVICCTFGLFVRGFANFDNAYEEGIFDYIITTNLTYRSEEMLAKPWYVGVDMSQYIGKIIDTMNHNIAVTSVISPTSRLLELVKETQEAE
ncbi:MAG: ribose-phosphate pyrophosphokinase [Lachnospiraceae bacterium]|nr:ribose-phosphate pyrophosphokinase [Lachnospiraceae bacterium]